MVTHIISCTDVNRPHNALKFHLLTHEESELPMNAAMCGIESGVSSQ